MKTILAIGISAAALIGASSFANAQQDCINGWHMIKDQIPARCDTLPSAFSGPGPVDEPVLYEGAAPVVVDEGPMFTGSINTTSEADVDTGNADEIPGSWRFASSREECQPGQYYMLELESNDRPVAC